MTRGLDADVLVVGAGVAGLTAARALRADGLEVAVLEARDRVGGRTVSEQIGNGEQVEMGGQWVGPTQDRVLALIAELGLGTFPTRTDGDNLLELGGRLRRYRGTIPKLGPLVLLDLEQARRRLDRLSRRVDPAAPWKAADAQRLDSVSFADWIRRTARTGTARELMRVAGRTVWGAEPEAMSLLHALAYVRGGGGFDKLLDVEGGAQQDRVVGGSQLIATRMAARLGERVALGAPVRRIAWGENGVMVESDGGSVAARRAIVATPPQLVGRIAFEPALPQVHELLGQAMTGGWLIKLTAVYDEPFWRQEGLSGEAVSAGGPITVAFDNSPPSGLPGALVGFVGGADAPGFAALPPGERERVALDCFARLFGARARHARMYLERDWLAEEWSRGGPVSVLPTGGLTAAGPALRQAVGPLHWAATERATRWAGYIDGAVRSGEAAASEVLTAL